MLSEERGRAVIEQLIGLSHADEVQVDLESKETTHLRFARSSPSTSGNASDATLSVKSWFGKRSASATVNQLDEAALKEVIERSEHLAKLAPEDSEYVPNLGAQSYPSVNAYDDVTRTRGAHGMMEGSTLCVEQARERGLEAAGFTIARARSTFIGNRQGLRGFHRSTEVSFSETVRSPQAGSGWAASGANSIAGVDYARCSATAIDKAQRSVSPRPLAPGKYVTILEPACVASLMRSLLSSMNQRSADEGRSFFSAGDGKTKLGQQLFPEQVTIRSDPASSAAPGAPWADGGLPQLPRTWIDRGRIANLACERFWAQKTGREPIPSASNLLMSGGSGTVADLVSSTERGVLITSLWYMLNVNPRTLLYTGLTRDGVFWIENGKIAYPVTNFRWNDSPISVLSNIDGMSESVRASPRESTSTNISVPALRVKEFQLSSVSDAV
jgi:predicted Zn-dependent protease